jgi:hypothetical protein
MKKVILRRKEVLNHLPKEIRAGAKVSIGSIYVNRQPLKGVDGEEAAKFLAPIIDVPPTHADWPKKEKDFWASMTVKVPFEGKELDISLDEDGYPHNTMDYLTFRWCQKHRMVASSEAEMKNSPEKKFYIYDPEADLLKKNALTKLRKDADREFIKISADVDKMRRLILVLSKGSRPDILSEMEVENQLYDLKNANPERFLKYCLDKNLDIRAEIEELIQFNVLRTIGNQIIYGDEVIGETIVDAIVYFNNKKNSGQILAMKAQLKEIKV